jgi:hypothetical protein
MAAGGLVLLRRERVRAQRDSAALVAQCPHRTRRSMTFDRPAQSSTIQATEPTGYSRASPQS